MKPKRFVFQSQMFGFARCKFLLLSAGLSGWLVTVGPQKQVFAQDKVQAPNVISQSDLIGSQVLETPYGVMTIENAYPEYLCRCFKILSMTCKIRRWCDGWHYNRQNRNLEFVP